MIRLKELRDTARMTQLEVAAAVGTTQQTYARWEAGKTKPSHDALRALARLFSTSVDRVLGPEDIGAPNQRAAIATWEAEGLWGHLGLRLPGAPLTNWYPISENEASKFRQRRSSGHTVAGWLIVRTLNNRVLAFRPEKIQRAFLLDEADSEPLDDFEFSTLLDHELISAATYLALAQWADSEIEGCNEFFESNPKAVQKDVVALAKRAGYAERAAELRAILRATVIHFTDGQKSAYEADREMLSDLFLYIEAKAELDTIELNNRDAARECFYTKEMVCLIEFPSIELEAAWDGADA